MDFSNVEAPVISSSSTNEVVDVNLPKNNDISDLIPKVEENKPAVELPKTEEEKKEEQINVDEVFDKYIKDEGVISLYFHNKLYIDYKERQEIVNDETLNNNILKLMIKNFEDYKDNYYVNILADQKILYLKKYMDVDFGEDIQELKNKNLIVYGYKNSGKTTLIRKLLSKLNNFKIFVFSKENLIFKEDNIVVFNDFSNMYQVLNQNPDYIYINKLDELFIEYYDLFKSFKVILESKNNTKYLFKDYLDVKVEKAEKIKFTIEKEEKKEEVLKEPKKEEEEEIDLLEI
jgi:Molybdopterin guanine dinucleotide synthesis protein B.